MRVTTVRIKNFRGISELEVALDQSTVVLGENNVGKSSLLDAIRLALGRRWGQRGSGFSEYDFQLTNGEGGLNAPEIRIELELAEEAAGEWAEEIVQALNHLLDTDTHGRHAIGLRVTCQFSELTQAFEPKWEFLRRDGQPLGGKQARAANFSRFFPFVPVFSLSALRDANQEFTAKSVFWGNLLRSISIPADKRADIEEKIEQLNNELLNADPTFGEIKNVIGELNTVVPPHVATEVNVRALPVKSWDLISRSEVVVRGRQRDPWLPINRHGQGVQSLGVIYLFRAFVGNVLRLLYGPQSEPVLTLEEPEAHLHPQAARSLWPVIAGLPGQKIVSTHSPYFVERVPLRHLRILRKRGGDVQVYSLPSSFEVTVRSNEKIKNFVANSDGKFQFDEVSGLLTVRGAIEVDGYRRLLKCFAEVDERDLHSALRKFADESRKFVDDEELSQLQTWARRIRGEIFFSQTWLLCEGQSEYTLLHAIGSAIQFPLDKHGVSVIDYQNNGSPAAFAALARALGFEWVITCDGDAAGDGHLESVRARHFSADFLKKRFYQLPKVCLEEYCIRSGFGGAAKAAAVDLLGEDANARDDDELVHILSQDRYKIGFANALAQRISETQELERKLPAEYKSLFETLRELAQ